MRFFHEGAPFSRNMTVCVLATVFLLGACSSGQRPLHTSADPVLKLRREKDVAYKSSPRSPIPAEDKDRFQGLDYFPINLALRFRLKLSRYPAPLQIRMATNTGEIREGLRYGYFEFQMEAQTYRLQVYRLDDHDNAAESYLFVPFLDATSGKETYGAGRYLDFPENTSGMYDVDFNQAYNPSCAYGGDFSCPRPPEENRLKVQIRAGEKKYPLARHD
jgi:uncharacterized protein (DUF1684 family)